MLAEERSLIGWCLYDWLPPSEGDDVSPSHELIEKAPYMAAPAWSFDSLHLPWMPESLLI